jgi:hypothetical protein
VPCRRRARRPDERGPRRLLTAAPAAQPAGSIATRRRVHADGRIVVNKQFMKLGPSHAGKLVTVIIEDTCYRVLHGEEETIVKSRKDTRPIKRIYARGMKTQA